MKHSLLIAAGLCLAIISCNRSSPNENDAKDIVSTADSTGAFYNNGSSSAAVENASDTLHKFVRTADIKFKVNNVEQTTYQVENIITSHGGFVTFTQLQSNVGSTSTVPVSEDSAVESATYTVVNNMTFRVPNNMLDTTLKEIAHLVAFLDYRVIKADDVSQQLYASQLRQRRSDLHATRMMSAIEQGSKKLADVGNAEATVEQKEEARDEALLSGMALKEQVRFSTVQLSIYQPETVHQQVLATYKEPKRYIPSFRKRIWQALVNGYGIVESILLALVHIWPFTIGSIGGVILYKKYAVKWKK